MPNCATSIATIIPGETVLVLIWVYVGALGACIGSFLNVVIYRLPLEKSIVRPGSHCPKCETPIRWYDNIPIISYIVLWGKCRKCGEKISLRYPAVEATAMCIALLDLYLFGISWHTLIVLILSMGMLAVALIDFDHMIIPDELSIGGTAVGLALSLLPGGFDSLHKVGQGTQVVDGFTNMPLFHSFVGAAVGAGSLFIIRYVHMKLSGVEGMGLGDVKLAGTIGAFVGWQGLPLVLFASSISGLIVGGGYILIKRKGKRTPIPFGTFLALGTVVYAMGEPFWMTLLMKTMVVQ